LVVEAVEELMLEILEQEEEALEAIFLHQAHI
jgi:hypothetical protein